MTPRPVLFRLFVPFIGMILLIVIICGATVYVAGQNTLRRQQFKDLDRMAQLISRDLSTPLSASRQQEIGALAQVMETRVTLIASDGTVLLDTDANAASMANHNDRPEVIDARATGVGSRVRESSTIHERGIYLARLLDTSNGIVVRVSYPQRTWIQFASSLSGILLAAAASAAMVLLWLVWVLRRQWINPVEYLAQAAERMSAGEWDTRVEPRGADVVRFFSGRLNVVAAQAEKQLADLNHQRADLRALVDSLPDAILLTDSQDRIALLNAPAARLLQVTAAQAVGRPLMSVVIEEPILKLLDDLNNPNASAETLATVQRRSIRLHRAGQILTYQAVATRAQAGGVLLVLQNISALAATVQMKTDFVANASHELRTPIAAIKIAFETLRECHVDDPVQTARCIDIIEGHIKRLEEMLADLLDLSRVESPDARPILAHLHARDLVANLRSAMQPMAEQKQIRLVFDYDEGFTFVSDIRLLQLVLKNLIENSIKFTPANGTVTTRITQSDTRIQMQVIDTGIGIAPEYQERVFERFYQVDPARTGSVGRGTGLGLAIVKHAMNALRGEVELKSTLGKGTTVTCSFPISG